MFKFAKLSNVKAAVVTTAKSQSQLVKELHNEFDTATDRIIENANIILAKAANERAERLRRLGFGSNKEVLEDRRLKFSKEESGLLAELVERYKKVYPAYKFITHGEVIRIAEKYGLVLGKASDFIGYVPEENLIEIENANIRAEDYAIVDSWGTWDNEILYAPLDKSIRLRDKWSKKPKEPKREPTETIDDLTRMMVVANSILSRGDYIRSTVGESRPQRDSGLKIVAPLKDFNTIGKIVKNNQLIKDDPIVLHPVIGGYLILTAWGPEANDPMVKR